MSKCTSVKLAFNAVEPEGGAGDKPPVICAHGLSGSKEHWADLMQTLADATKRKVYAIDARNHGDSAWTDVFNFDCNVVDFLHFMDTHGIPKAIIIGHSMGGVTAFKTALRAPERVEKLIVEDMSVKIPSPEVIGMVTMMTATLQKGLQLVPNDADQERAKNIIFEFFVSQIPEEHKDVCKPESFKNVKVELKRAADGSYAFKANMDVLMKALQNPSELMTPAEGIYEGPAIFVYGELSPFQVGLDEQTIRSHFPNAELTGIENATHAVHFDCPKEFTKTILNFILKK